MSDLLFSTDGPIATITLNRPEARNAYSESMVAALIDSLDRAAEDDSIRVVIVTGNGPCPCGTINIAWSCKNTVAPESGAPVSGAQAVCGGAMALS